MVLHSVRASEDQEGLQKIETALIPCEEDPYRVGRGKLSSAIVGRASQNRTRGEPTLHVPPYGQTRKRLRRRQTKRTWQLDIGS